MTNATGRKRAAVWPCCETGLSHEAKLDRLAEVAVRVGLGLAPGQELLMTAPLDTLPLVRKITEHAYKAGASVVTTLFTDEEATLLRFRYAPDESFDRVPEWLHTESRTPTEAASARLAVSGSNPALLAGQDPKKISRANLALSKASASGARPDYAARNQLDHRGLRHPSLGPACFPGPSRRFADGPSLGRDLCGDSDRCSGSRGELARTRRRSSGTCQVSE